MSSPGAWNESTFSRFVYLSDPGISRSGDVVSFALTRVNLDRNRYETAVGLYDLRTDTEHFIQDAKSPRLSPDGRKVVYTREGQDMVEVWVTRTSEVAPSKLFEVKSVQDVRWSPEGRALLVVSQKRREDEDFYYHSGTPYWFDGRGFLDGERVLLGIYDSESGVKLLEYEAPAFLLPGVPAAIWHGRDIIVNAPRERNPFEELDILLYREGVVEKLFEDVSYYALDSDGSSVLLHGKPKTKAYAEHNYLYLYENGQTVRLGGSLPYSVFYGALDGSGRAIAGCMKEGKQVLVRLGVDFHETLLEEEKWVTAFSVAKSNRVAFTMESPTEPAEVYLLDGGVKRLTNFNSEALHLLAPRRPVRFTYESFDGRGLEGWYYKPDGGKAPVVLMIHGGPKGMYGYGFNIQAQLLVNNGYFVVMTNPRGSNGYSEEFALEVLGKPGVEDFRDIMMGLDRVLALEPEADRSRMGVTGISYGGFMTNWAVTHTDLFKAAVSENGISDWFSSYAFSDIGLWFDYELVGAESPSSEKFRKASPVYYADRVTTPILLIHSLEDYRCPLDQSLMFHHVLRNLEKESHLIVFKRGAHSHGKEALPRHRLKRYRVILEFFRQKLVEGKSGFANI